MKKSWIRISVDIFLVCFFIGGFIVCVGLWTCAMPQIWGTGIRITHPIPHFTQFNVLATMLVASIGIWSMTRLVRLRSKQKPVIWIGMSTACFIIGKVVAQQEEKTAITLGESVILAKQTDRMLPQLRYSSRIAIHGDMTSRNWSMSIKGRVVPWWEIDYNPDVGWFYVQD